MIRSGRFSFATILVSAADNKFSEIWVIPVERGFFKFLLLGAGDGTKKPNRSQKIGGHWDAPSAHHFGPVGGF